MTQIKLRRDTSAAFASSNPILGNGEPAYETDTKKLKIGDGTTAYTQLEYFSAGGGGSTNISATLPLKIVNGVISLEVDGQTIQIVDGKLTASSTAPTNMVTTDTAQTITGQKEFSHTILSLNQDLIRGQQSTSYRNGAGLSIGANSTSTDGGVFAPQWKIYSTTGDVDRTETIITTYNQSKLNSSNFNTANKLVRLDSDGKLPAVDGSNLTNLPGGGGTSRNVGEIIQSSLPLTDAGLHLLDGSRLSGDGIYKGFVDYIADLYNNTKVYNPSAFTVVGSPTITDDGIASGFSSNSFLQVNIDLSNKPFIFETPKFVYSQVASDRQYLFTYGSYNTNLFMQTFITSTGALNTSMRNNTTDIFYKSYQLTLNNSYQIKYVLNTTEASIYLKTNDNDYELLGTTTNTSLYTVNSTNMRIGQEYNGSTRFYSGSIDLKQFSITVDGKEVFSGSKPANYFTTESAWQSSVSTYGSCGKFVYDSTLNTVRLPKVTGIIEGTTDIRALGDLVEAGLPNITGNISTPFKLFSGSGAFRAYADNWHNLAEAQSAGEYSNFDFDASRSNAIYGNSSTVQPQTIKAFVYIVIATSSKTDIQVDIDKIATDLNGKADVDLSNINASQSAKNEIISWGMPDYSARISVSGNGFTASTDGVWYVLAYNLSAFQSYIVVNNIQTSCGLCGTSGYQDQSAIALYLSKGDVVRWSANPSSILSSTFYPLKGAN